MPVPEIPLEQACPLGRTWSPLEARCLDPLPAWVTDRMTHEPALKACFGQAMRAGPVPAYVELRFRVTPAGAVTGLSVAPRLPGLVTCLRTTLTGFSPSEAGADVVYPLVISVPSMVVEGAVEAARTSGDPAFLARTVASSLALLPADQRPALVAEARTALDRAPPGRDVDLAWGELRVATGDRTGAEQAFRRALPGLDALEPLLDLVPPTEVPALCAAARPTVTVFEAVELMSQCRAHQDPLGWASDEDQARFDSYGSPDPLR